MEHTFIPSDERIKECICSLKDLLPKLDQIDFVSYDRIGRNTISHEVGVLAQNVANVFPNMVSFTRNQLPNIQQKAEHTLMADDIVFIRLTNTLPLKDNDDVLFHINQPGDRVRNYLTNVIHATDVSIEIKKWGNYSPTDELFIYGTTIDDFHSVDISQIGVLGAACAKELHQLVKCQAETIATLQAANAATSSQLAALNGTCAALKKQIDDITARLS
jgi:Chaperone of endosialidase